MTVFDNTPSSVRTSYQCWRVHSIEKADSATWGGRTVLLGQLVELISVIA